MTEIVFPLFSSSWGSEETAALHAVIADGMFTMGERVRAFEAAFAAYHGRAHAVMVNSGSSANLVATAALCHRKEKPLRPGDEVIVPAIGWSTTYAPLQQYGLKLRFVDVDLETLNIDTAQLEAALTERTRAIAIVSVLGNPADLPTLRAFADAHDLILFEDNCESLDAEIGGRKTGTYGEVATSSFFFSHHISTMEGGMIVTDDRELADLARVIRAHGWTRDLAPDSPVAQPRGNDRFEQYRFIMPGYNVRPGEMHAAVGLVQLAKLPDMTAQRRRNWAHFQSVFATDDRFVIQRETGKSSSFAFTMIVRPEAEIDRAALFDGLTQAGIAYRIVTGGNFLKHEAIAHFDHTVVGGGTPNADLVHENGFFVGNHAYDLTRQIDYLNQTLGAIG